MGGGLGCNSCVMLGMLYKVEGGRVPESSSSSRAAESASIS